jgi:taurine--2-oxoglutarate transaminase
VTRGEGVHVYDDEGDEWLDFVSQLYCVNAGHNCQPIVDAIAEQAGTIPYVSPTLHSDVRSELAGKITEVAPEPLSDVYFSVTGSEANEAAVQMARAYTGASKVLTRWRSYHGATYGAGSLTGDPESRAEYEQYASTTGSVKFLPPMSYRSPFDADSPEELAERAADHVEFVVRNEGPDTVAAILMEPVAGSSGGYTAPPGYFERLREICDEYDILLIADEVLAGFGRCGDWFSIQTEGVEPDMLTFAKGVTSGYVPLAGVVSRPEIADHVRSSGFDVGQTFGGHPVACAAGCATMDVYADGLIQNVRDLGPVLADHLGRLEASHDVVGHTRGRGFLRAVEFTDPETGEPFFDPRADSGDDNPVSAVLDETKDRRVLFGAGRPTFQVMIAPPLVATEEDIAAAVDVLDEAIEAVF